MVPKWSVILSLGIIQNERGATLIVTIILLFFISHFLFSIKLWHDSLYMNYNSLEVYYEKKVIQYLNNRIEENEAPFHEVNFEEEVESTIIIDSDLE